MNASNSFFEKLYDLLGELDPAVTITQKLEALARTVTGEPADELLDYDRTRLLQVYAGETPIAPFIPYSELFYFGCRPWACTVSITPGPFMLHRGTPQWQAMAEEGFVYFKQQKKLWHNENTIRLGSVAVNGRQCLLNVQQATYEDQARSNLVLDFPNAREAKRFTRGSYLTLRSQLKQEYGNRLPPLSDPRLANTVGISCLVFYRGKNGLTPCLVKRTAHVGVFPGKVQCTASGVAKWPAEPLPATEHFFTAHMYSELEEEAGLLPADLDWMQPLALCREFARGGKPQLLYAAIAAPGITREVLAQKRKQAVRNLGNDEFLEVKKDGWLTRADVPLSAASSKVYGPAFSHETLASLFYWGRLLKELRG